ncbi:MAG: signal peptidase I [Dethiobacter sp.]|jgi:signal peptidase|nr:MAG: signal peptidase I [Dethiobacter sp.]
MNDKLGKNKNQKKEQKRPGALVRMFGVLGNIIFVLMLLVMSALVFFLVQSKIAGNPPGVAGYQMLIVISGSMNPTFDTGSVVFVRPMDPKNLAAGDIITFKGSGGSDKLTTHRIVDVHTEDGLGFTTRGDANNVNDPNIVPARNVVGKVVLAIPYAGYLFNYVQTKEGYIALILIPGVLIIFTELYKLLKYARQVDKKESTGKKDKRLASGKHPEEAAAEIENEEDEAALPGGEEPAFVPYYAHKAGFTAGNYENADYPVSQVRDRRENEVKEVLEKEKIIAAVKKTAAVDELAFLNKAAVVDKTAVANEAAAVDEIAAVDKTDIIKEAVILKETAVVNEAVVIDEITVLDKIAALPAQSSEFTPVTSRKPYHGGNEEAREKIWRERAFAILSGLPVVVDENGEERVWKERAFAMLSGLAVVIDDSGKEEVS